MILLDRKATGNKYAYLVSADVESVTVAIEVLREHARRDDLCISSADCEKAIEQLIEAL